MNIMKSTNNALTATNIAAEQFKGNLDLASYTIPNGVTSIGDRAFYDCSSLTSTTIPDNVEIIGDGAFNGPLSQNKGGNNDSLGKLKRKLIQGHSS